MGVCILYVQDGKGEPMSKRLIYAEDAIDAINHICPVDTEYDCTLLDRVDVRCVLSDLPTAQPQWIPCSERLPYMWDERYLVSLAWGGIGVMEYKSTGFHNYGSFTPVPIESITAWMPLPEPYKERRTDDKR